MNPSDIKLLVGTPRRGIFGRVAGGLALGIAALAPSLSRAQTAPLSADEPHWPGELKGRYHQVVDGYAISDAAPLSYSQNFLTSNPAGAASSVLILRDMALVIAMDDAIWAKYKIGEVFDIIDPGTKTTAVKNPFLRPRSGVLRNDAAAIDRVIAAGVIVGACNIALHGMSRTTGAKIGISADDAAKDWIANVVPGITVLPSGVWGLNRAQLAGCTYCAGG